MSHGIRLLLLATLLGACVRPDPSPRFTPAWERFDPAEGNWSRTRCALLIADCQIHNLYSKPLPERNLSAEAAAATAIRPPQLDLFSPDVLAWILEHGAPEAEVILHLGDALDLACTGEFERFLEVMETSDKPWFMAPGNHDFFYFGTYDPQDDALWEDASHGAGEPLPKDRFIRLYVAALLRQSDGGIAAFAGSLGLPAGSTVPLAEVADQVPDAFEWCDPGDAGGFLDAICWRIDRENPWRSYILQRVDVTMPGEERFRAKVYLVDSCQYQRQPELIPNAWKSFPLHLNCGLTGEMLPDQLRKVRAWIESDPAGISGVVMCHHPFESLAPRTRSSLGWLWRERRLSMMVTAHTHGGYFAHHDLGGDSDEIELNLGSTTDWPMEWRTLDGYVNVEKERIYLRAGRRTLVDALRAREGYFKRGWEVPLDAPDDYRRYKQGEAANDLLIDFYLAHHLTPYWMKQPKVRANEAARRTEEQVKDTLLWTYFRLLQHFPTDPASGPQWPRGCTRDREVQDRIVAMAGRSGALPDKVVLLQELERFERSRATRDPETGESLDEERVRFKVSQAAWAARFESARGRRLSVEDDLIRVDWERAAARREAATEDEGDGERTR